MATWEPDIDPFDRDEIEDDRWDENVMNDLQKRYEDNLISNIIKVVIRIPERKHRSL